MIWACPVRAVLYLCTLVAITCCPVIRDYYRHLKHAGQPSKSPIARTRKLM
jgi:hypothetical protein